MKIIYNVEKFDTLESIANKFNVSVLELKHHNNITSELPKTIEIPKSNLGYKVIANLKREFVLKNGNENAVKALNKLGLFSKNKNQEIMLFSPRDNNIYVVGILDTLNSICNKFKLNKEEIIKINNLKTEKLFIGQILKLS